MSLTIPLAHDFSCPWCWIATFQVERLKKEFDVEIEWLSYELWPAELERPPAQARAANPLQPSVPSRLDLMLALERVEIPQIERPRRMSTHNAHLAAQYALSEGMGEPYIWELYRAHWERGESLEESELLANLGAPLGLNSAQMLASIAEERFADQIVHFDAPAYRTGIFHVPTFIVAGRKLAEQPFHVIEQAVVEATRRTQ
jgi:predicted DsbA family dithiol-disulfide isomerase